MAAAVKPATPEINIVLVADVDVISPAFFQLREQAEIPELGMRIDLDNVTFALNALDELAGDHRFAAIRSHRPKYRTLTRIEERTEASTLKAAKQRNKFYDDCEKKLEEQQAKVDERVNEIRRKPEPTPTTCERLKSRLKTAAASWTRPANAAARTANATSKTP